MRHAWAPLMLNTQSWEWDTRRSHSFGSPKFWSYSWNTSRQLSFDWSSMRHMYCMSHSWSRDQW